MQPREGHHSKSACAKAEAIRYLAENHSGKRVACSQDERGAALKTALWRPSQARAGKRLCAKTVIRAKKKWGVSASALSYRLHKLGVITDWQYRTFMIQLNSDYNKKEPDGLPAEKSHVWKTVL
jgi:hypothetical protein